MKMPNFFSSSLPCHKYDYVEQRKENKNINNNKITIELMFTSVSETYCGLAVVLLLFLLLVFFFGWYFLSSLKSLIFLHAHTFHSLRLASLYIIYELV